MKYYIYSIVFLLLISIPAYSNDAETEKGLITVVVENIRNDKGQMRACLFNKKEGFPDDYQTAYKHIVKEITNKDNMIFEFDGLDYQEYAVAVFHDEDEDSILKQGFLGIPREGYGISNNAKGRFGPPSFEDAKINLNSKNISINIELIY